MNPLEAALLGLLQGLTEFLPVSSSGHLVLGQALLGIHVPGVAFEVAVHVATLLAVLVVYRSRIVELVRGLLTGDRDSAAYVGLLAVASVPAAAVGLTARPFFEGAFERPSLAAGFLLLSGVFAWSIDRATHRQAAAGAVRERPSLTGAVVVGLAQALAILPGISRSGSTVAAGAGTGVGVVRMAEFSFLLSVPAIAGAALLQAMGREAAWGRGRRHRSDRGLRRCDGRGDPGHSPLRPDASIATLPLVRVLLLAGRWSLFAGGGDGPGAPVRPV